MSIEVVKWYTRRAPVPAADRHDPRRRPDLGRPVHVHPVLRRRRRARGRREDGGAVGPVRRDRQRACCCSAAAYAAAVVLGRLPIGSRNPLAVAAGRAASVELPTSGQARRPPGPAAPPAPGPRSGGHQPTRAEPGASRRRPIPTRTGRPTGITAAERPATAKPARAATIRSRGPGVHRRCTGCWPAPHRGRSCDAHADPVDGREPALDPNRHGVGRLDPDRPALRAAPGERQAARARPASGAVSCPARGVAAARAVQRPGPGRGRAPDARRGGPGRLPGLGRRMRGDPGHAGCDRTRAAHLLACRCRWVSTSRPTVRWSRCAPRPRTCATGSAYPAPRSLPARCSGAWPRRPGSRRRSRPRSNPPRRRRPRWCGCTSTASAAACSRTWTCPPRPANDVAAQLLTAKASSALTEPWLDEAGQSDLPGRSLARLNPTERAGSSKSPTRPPSTLARPATSRCWSWPTSPTRGMVFPGSELVGRIDESGLYVDWAMRLSVRASAAVAAKNQRALRNLNEQYGQRAGEVSHGLNMLERVASDLAEYVAILESDKLEVETQATTIFCVAGPGRRHSPRPSPRPVRLPRRHRVQAGATAGIPGTAVVGDAPGCAVRAGGARVRPDHHQQSPRRHHPAGQRHPRRQQRLPARAEHRPRPVAGPERAVRPDQRHPARPRRGQRPAHLRVHGRRRGARRRKGAGPRHAHSHTIGMGPDGGARGG